MQNGAFKFLIALYRSAGVSFFAFYVFIYKKKKVKRILKKSKKNTWNFSMEDRE